MLRLAPLGCAVIIFFMGALHMLLALGAPLGEYVLGGSHRTIPREKRYINILLAGLFLLLGVCYLKKAGMVCFQLPEMLLNSIVVLFTIFLAYAIVGNIFFTHSKKEKIVMIPASVLGFISSLLTLIFC